MGPAFPLRRFVRFAGVGAAGFLVDAGVLAALHHAAGVDALAARIVSISAAVLVTWRLNRRHTFGPSTTGQASEGLRYGLVAALHAGLNYGIYAAALTAMPDLLPVAGLLVSTLAAMAFSYLGYSRFVFAVTASPRLHRR